MAAYCSRVDLCMGCGCLFGRFAGGGAQRVSAELTAEAADPVIPEDVKGTPLTPSPGPPNGKKKNNNHKNRRLTKVASRLNKKTM